MKWLQKLLTAALPASWGESMRAESQSWQIRCRSCGTARSIWDVGGIRWQANSRSKFTLIRCPHCRRIRIASIERAPKPPGTDRSASRDAQG